MPPRVTHEAFEVSRRERLLVYGTAVGILLSAFGLGLIYAHDSTMELVGIIPMSIFAVGKFLPLWGLGKSHFTPWELGFAIWCLDTFTVLTVVYGLAALDGIRPVRVILAKLRYNARMVLTAYPGLHRSATVGVILFVLFPVAGTGALAGSLLGILLGLHRFVLIAAVSLGGLLGGMLMAFAATHFGEAMERLRTMQSDPLVKWISIGLVVLGVVLLFLWINRAYRRAIRIAEEAQQEG